MFQVAAVRGQSTQQQVSVTWQPDCWTAGSLHYGLMQPLQHGECANRKQTQHGDWAVQKHCITRHAHAASQEEA